LPPSGRRVDQEEEVDPSSDKSAGVNVEYGPEFEVMAIKPRFLTTLFRTYPWQSTLTLFALLIAGLAEGFGLSALIPLLGIVVGDQEGGALQSLGHSMGGSKAENLVRGVFSMVGVAPTVETLILFIVVAILLKCGLVLLANRQVGYMSAHVATDLRLQLLRALLASRWEHHVRQPIGALANAMATEPQRSSKAFLSATQMAVLLIQAIVYVGVALLVSWEAALVTLGIGLLILYGLGRWVRKARQAGLRQTKLLKSLLAHLTDVLHSIKPLKAMGRETLAESVLMKETIRLNKTLKKQVIVKEALRASQEGTRTIFLASGLYIALVVWRLPFTTVMMLMFLMGRFLMQIGKVQSVYQELATLDSAYWSLRKTITAAKEHCEPVLGTGLPVFQKGIRFDHVGFSYEGKQVLRDVTVTFHAGSFTAIVGPSGSGKTTLVDLMTGLLRPKTGEIWIDEAPLQSLDLKRWRQMIGYVPQEPLLLHDTIMNNVTLGDPEVSELEVEEALRGAGAWDFVQDMDKKLLSSVGERGDSLSGGQRQRIAIARALVRGPRLLILDEATSALDQETQSSICATLKKRSGKLTVLAISHRQALIDVADKAYRVEQGSLTAVIRRDHERELDGHEAEGPAVRAVMEAFGGRA
jgi:ATP-binding cassette subfamily C protein